MTGAQDLTVRSPEVVEAVDGLPARLRAGAAVGLVTIELPPAAVILVAARLEAAREAGARLATARALLDRAAEAAVLAERAHREARRGLLGGAILAALWPVTTLALWAVARLGWPG